MYSLKRLNALHAGKLENMFSVFEDVARVTAEDKSLLLDKKFSEDRFKKGISPMFLTIEEFEGRSVSREEFQVKFKDYLEKTLRTLY